MDIVCNPGVEILSPLELLRDIEGFYSVEVITATLEDHGYRCVHINPDVLMHASEREVGVSLFTDNGIYIVRETRHQHWVCLKSSGERLTQFDSKCTASQELSIVDGGTYLQRNCHHPGAIINRHLKTPACHPLAEMLLPITPVLSSTS